MLKRLTAAAAVLAAAVLAAAVVDRASAERPESAFIKVKDDELEFRSGKSVVAVYRKGPKVAKPYLWPVLAPTGVPITRAWPMEPAKEGESTDHIHQKSAWFCHGDVIPEDFELTAGEKSADTHVKGVDFWSENKGHGVIACTKVGEPEWTNKEHSFVATQNEWRTAEGRKILDESRTIHLYGYDNARLFVFDTDLHASVCPVTFGDTKEGSFGIRINDAIREEIVVNKKKMKGPGKLENAEGKEGEANLWGLQSAWCDYSGPIDGQTVGLAILADPSNRYASCWHSRGYGLMAANPFGRAGVAKFPGVKDKELVRLAKGEHLKMRYGILVHKGDAKEGKVGEWFERFVKLKDQ